MLRCSLGLFVFIITPLVLLAQPGQDLRKDTLFFQQQAQLYQRWLDQSGLTDYVHFRELDVQERAIALYLEFNSDDIDWVVNAWNKMKQAYEASSDLTLEQQLFYKAEALMEVNQTLLSVQLYDTYDSRKTPLFQRAIYFAEGQVQSQTSDPQSEIDYVELPAPRVDGEQGAAVAEFQQQYSKAHVFDCIVRYATARFTQEKCIDRHPEIRVLEDQQVLRFKVTDLCKEVLREESSVICEWLRSAGYDCEWAKRELLTFTITYEKTIDGIRVRVEIEGKIGSGFYDSVGRGGYVDMEIDRDEELEEYGDLFAQGLRQMLAQCQ